MQNWRAASSLQENHQAMQKIIHCVFATEEKQGESAEQEMYKCIRLQQ